MNEKDAPKAGLAVSVEREAAKGAYPIRLASGILVAGDLVFVPNPPQSLVNQKDALRVVIASRSPKAGQAERIHVTGVQTLSLDVPGARTPRVAVLRLAEHSQYVVKVPDVMNSDLAEILIRTGGDLWATLAELGYVTTERPDAETETAAATSLADGHFRAITTFCGGICDWLPCCRR